MAVEKCKHGDELCPGPDAEGYPELCCECWDEWAEYDPDSRLLPEEDWFDPNQINELVEKYGPQWWRIPPEQRGGHA